MANGQKHVPDVPDAKAGMMAEFIIIGATRPRCCSSAGAPVGYPELIATPCGKYCGGGTYALIVERNCHGGIVGMNVEYDADGANESQLLNFMVLRSWLLSWV
jgi:hypothetical protein